MFTQEEYGAAKGVLTLFEVSFTCGNVFLFRKSLGTPCPARGKRVTQ